MLGKAFPLPRGTHFFLHASLLSGPDEKSGRREWPRRRPIRGVGGVRVCNWRPFASSHTLRSLLRPRPADHYPQQCFFLSFQPFSTIVIGVSLSGEAPSPTFPSAPAAVTLSATLPFPPPQQEHFSLDLSHPSPREDNNGGTGQITVLKSVSGVEDIIVHPRAKKRRWASVITLGKMLETFGWEQD